MNNEQKAFIREQYEKVWGGRSKMVEYCTKQTSSYVTIDGTVITFDKPSIETRFCFGEHGYDYQEVHDTCHRLSQSEDYFMSENLRNTVAATIIERLEGRDWRGYKPFLKRSRYYTMSDPSSCKLGCVVWSKSEYDDSVVGLHMLDENEKAVLLEAAKREQALFEKRLRTYLKRYGMSKCHFWVFWADA